MPVGWELTVSKGCIDALPKVPWKVTVTLVGLLAITSVLPAPMAVCCQGRSGYCFEGWLQCSNKRSGQWVSRCNLT